MNIYIGNYKIRNSKNHQTTHRVPPNLQVKKLISILTLNKVQITVQHQKKHRKYLLLKTE